jgi:hypothetical protein
MIVAISNCVKLRVIVGTGLMENCILSVFVIVSDFITFPEKFKNANSKADFNEL